MDTVQILLENLGMFLALANQTMGYWMVVPANATGPLDANITLTSEGFNIVMQIANAAIAVSNVIGEAMEFLF